MVTVDKSTQRHWEDMPEQGSDEAQATFPEVAACFSEEEWEILKEWQKDLYRNVMKEVHQALLSLGPLIVSTVFSLRTKGKQDLSPTDTEEAVRSHGGTMTNPEESFSIKREEDLHLIHPPETEGRERKEDGLSSGECKDEDPASIIVGPRAEEAGRRILNPESGDEISNREELSVIKLEENLNSISPPKAEGRERNDCLRTAEAICDNKADDSAILETYRKLNEKLLPHISAPGWKVKEKDTAKNEWYERGVLSS
ncbi:zinc finger protein 282-like [Ambystoma mexicanum]|uniref:zinc finger protein 282-like n=1 Tax=Ambystoma mexicanum TaxID=8296 RepID=UPI0037E9C275